MLRNKVLVFTLAAVALSLCVPTVSAQSAVMPLPVAVVKDGNGTVVAQVVTPETTTDNWPMVILNLDGELETFSVRPFGFWHLRGNTIYFSGSGCSGTPYLDAPDTSGIEGFTNTSVRIMGPTSWDGTYRVFRSTSDVQSVYTISSQWDYPGGCIDFTPNLMAAVAAEEILPNPMEGIVGPSGTQPDRLWTIEGGTRIIPPAP